MARSRERIKRLARTLAPHETFPTEDLPIERWVDDLMRDNSGPALYGNEGCWYSWLEMLGTFFSFQIGWRIASARGEQLSFKDDIPPLTSDAVERVAAAVQPHIQCWQRRFEEATPQREAKRLLRKGYER